MQRRRIEKEPFASVTEDILLASGVPRRYWDASLDAVEGDPSFKETLRQFRERVHEHATDGMGLLLHGPFNTGKSCLAVVVLKAVVQRGGIAHFTPTENIPAIYYEDATIDVSFDEPVVIKDRMRRANLIILDDLGAESFDTHGPAGAKLERIIRTAYEEMQMLVVTTNLSMEKIEAKFTKGVVSLLQRITTGVEIVTEQWRS